MPKRLGVVVAAEAAAVAFAKEAVKKPGVAGLVVVVVGVLNNLLEGAVPPVKPVGGVEALAEKLLKMPVMVAVVVGAPNTILVVGVPPMEVAGVPPNILSEEAGVPPKMLPEELAAPPKTLPEVDGVPPNIPGPENMAGLLPPKMLGADAAVVGVFAPPNMLGESVVSFPKEAGVVDGADVAPNRIGLTDAPPNMGVDAVIFTTSSLSDSSSSHPGQPGQGGASSYR